MAKLFVQEQDSDKVHRLFELVLNKPIHFGAPDILIYEVGNTLWKRRDLQTGEILERLVKLLDLDIDFYSVIPSQRVRSGLSTKDEADFSPPLGAGENKTLLEMCCEISKKKEVTFYDAVYVALARQLGAKLITADEKMVNKFDTSISIETVLSEIHSFK